MKKPQKPRKDFPLYSHASGSWAKKINGKTHYFGAWSNPAEAESNYRDFIRPGRKLEDRKTYFIQHGVNGPIKIGSAKDPESRLKDLQVGNPVDLRIIQTIEANIESSLHAQLKKHRIRGEWFKPKPVMELLESMALSLQTAPGLSEAA